MLSRMLRYYETFTCKGCGAQVDGINGRYACTACGYVNPG